jgi:hypothetical protein
LEKTIVSLFRIEHSTVKVSQGYRETKEFLSAYPRSIPEHNNWHFKGKFVPDRAMNAHMGVEVSLHSFYTSLIDGGGGLNGMAASPLWIKTR